MTRARDIASGADFSTGIDAGEVLPHIIPNKLYPAWKGLLEDHASSVYSFTDSSDSAHVIKGEKHIHHSAIQKKTGNTAIRFDGINDTLTIADNADFDLGATGTIEAWIYVTGFPTSGWAPIMTSGDFTGSSTAGWSLTSWNAGSTPKMGLLVNNTWNNSGSSELPTNAWTHIALVRTGGDYKIYMNGTLGHSFTYATELVTATSLIIGQSKYNGTHRFQGWMDGIRITKGVAVYTGNFTPPTSLTETWSAGTNIAANSTSSNVKLLINSNEATTNFHSGAYGTAQSDSRSYYYTDIKGSKPIKDPRIGAHFGSQRYTFRSKQLLEQETATHGNDVYSVDGREWCRMVGSTWVEQNGNDGIRYYTDTVGNFIEITGYFSGANYLTFSSTTNDIALAIDGTTDTATYTGGTAAVDSPLKDRYVNMSVCVNLAFSSAPTLGIHTLKIYVVSGDYIRIEGIELIAQDVSSTANKSKIQIPSQNVVSYGKKFTVSGTPHYDPFNGFTSGNLAAVQALIDTDTSLGMANWLSSSTYYRPFNGGRVVKWVDSSGNIKTSVTMMPPNAQNISGTASSAHTLGNANDQTINFNTSAIDYSLSEVAKTFMALEFGNGSANGGTGATYADPTMLHSDGTADDIGYVMDDGLTSLSGDNTARSSKAIIPNSDDDYNYFTFIGTGVSINDPNGDSPGQYYPAQNMPYGTHILKSTRKSGTDAVEFIIDGVNLGTQSNCTKGRCEEITFYQPKKPPIPEDAVVIADYMLMADFVAQTSEGVENVSKGVRLIAPSRDMFYDRSAGSFHPGPFVPEPGASQFHINCWQGNASGTETRILPVFGDSFCMTFSTNSDTNTTAMPLTAGSAGTTALDNWTLTSGGSSVTSLSAAGSLVCAASGAKGFVCAKAGASVDLGIQQLKSVGTIASGGYHYQRTFGVHTPIHTSSHYQPFETPFLKELVGGDRNMEQHNLIVTPDGKSWDEVTRDTSYIGPATTTITRDGGSVTDAVYIWDYHRGSFNIGGAGSGGGCIFYAGWKGWVYAYDRIICLEEGRYRVDIRAYNNTANARLRVTINNDNDNHNGIGIRNTSSDDYGMSVFTNTFKRGDYIRCNTYNNISGDTDFFTNMFITRLDS